MQEWSASTLAFKVIVSLTEVGLRKGSNVLRKLATNTLKLSRYMMEMKTASEWMFCGIGFLLQATFTFPYLTV